MSPMALSMMSPVRGAAQAMTGTNSTSSTAASTASTSNAITSSDFMTLLVTEMKNQDPTQPTDPNAYIQQLVGVNSLQQLISINQDLTGIGTASTATPGVTTTSVGSVSES